VTGFRHTSVLLDESVAALQPVDGGVYVDATLGGGGHTAALLAAADCRVIGIDRDPDALAAAAARVATAGERFTAVRGSFSALHRLLDAAGVDKVDGILADLGVSSHQLGTAERGFSFQQAGPLDMRMDPDGPTTAADVANTWDEAALVDILSRYGEVRRARRVARAIVAGRPWSDTLSFADAVSAALGGRRSRTHPATRTFQALRIAVNDELQQLRTFLPTALDRLRSGGRLAVITFHSLEDRIVKRFLSHAAGMGRPRDPWGNPVGPVSVRLLPAVVPPKDDPNPRARSARLRSAERLPWNAQ